MNSLIKIPCRLFGYLTLVSEAIVQPLILLAFRVYWGWQLHGTGVGKLENHEKIVEFFTSLNIPLPGLNAWFVGGVEYVGGILLLLGLFARPTAALVSVTMLVAYISVPDDRAKLLGIFSDPEPFIAADPFFFLLTALLVLGFGPGKISLDWLLRRCCCCKRGSCSQPTE